MSIPRNIKEMFKLGKKATTSLPANDLLYNVTITEPPTGDMSNVLADVIQARLDRPHEHKVIIQSRLHDADIPGTITLKADTFPLLQINREIDIYTRNTAYSNGQNKRIFTLPKKHRNITYTILIIIAQVVFIFILDILTKQ